jgi:carbamoyltransferase
MLIGIDFDNTLAHYDSIFATEAKKYSLIPSEWQGTKQDLKDKRIKVTPEEESLFGIDKLNVKRSDIPAVTHVDYSARIQTVHKETNPKYHALITRFKEKTECSVVVNTSFNIRGEPIVCTPEDEFKCFMGTELDLLVVGNCVLKKEQQDSALIEDYKEKYELD